MAGMLTDTAMVGDQEQYAALMALMVRSIGLPARVVVGFVPPAAISEGPRPGPEYRGRRGRAAWPGHLGLGRGARSRAMAGWPSTRRRWTDTTASVDDRSPTERRAVTVEVPPALPQAQPDSVDAENANQRPDVSDPDEAAAAIGSPLLALLVTILGWLLLVLAVLALPVGIILGVKARAVADADSGRGTEGPDHRRLGGTAGHRG